MWKVEVILPLSFSLFLIACVNQPSGKLPVCSQMHSSPFPCFASQGITFPRLPISLASGQVQPMKGNPGWKEERRKQGISSLRHDPWCFWQEMLLFHVLSISCQITPLTQCCSQYWIVQLPDFNIIFCPPPSLGNDWYFLLLLISGWPDCLLLASQLVHYLGG